MAVNLILAVIKLIAGIIGHAYALVADAVESTADIFSSLVVYTPATAVCVEPQTAWPDALGDRLAGRPETGRRVIGPGEALRATMTLRWV